MKVILLALSVITLCHCASSNSLPSAAISSGSTLDSERCSGVVKSIRTGSYDDFADRSFALWDVVEIEVVKPEKVINRVINIEVESRSEKPSWLRVGTKINFSMKKDVFNERNPVAHLSIRDLQNVEIEAATHSGR